MGAADVQAYLSYLDTKQAAVAGTVSAAEITHQYSVVFNGFSALLTDDEVRALKKNSGVASISADSILQLDTSYTPTFLGLDKPGGIWEQLGGKAHAGEDIIIGIVDSGIWPENTAFADRLDENGVPSHSGSNVVYGAPPASWQGTCQTGEGFSAENCNNKLIGARYYRAATSALHWTEFLSPRDSVAGLTGHGGHGTHTASTAGGNNGAIATSNGVSLGKASGMAPRARIAAYKVCWTAASTGRNGCATADSVAAIDQAVKDGVNVINFSIGPNAGGGAFDEPTEVAFLGAAAAGVFVATSGGNSGPATPAPDVPAPVSHISPWLATVANSTHNRLYAGNVILSNGTKLEGASSNAKTPALPLIRSRDAGLAGVLPTDLNLLRCFGAADATSAYLDPAKVAGKILVCDRGGNVLVNKSANARTAGAAGVVIANVAGGANTIINQAHALSTVHLAQAQGDALKAFMAANARRHGGTGRHPYCRRHDGAGADRQRPFLARAERGQREHPETRPVGARHQRARRRDGRPDAGAARCRGGRRRGASRRNGISIPAPRWPARTWPAWRRCSSSSIRLVACGHQVGADDDGLQHVSGWLERFRVVGCHGEELGPAAVGPGRRPHRAEQRGRSRPRVRRVGNRLCALPVRPEPEGLQRRHLPGHRQHRRLQPEPGVADGGQRAGHASADAHGDQRGRQQCRLQRLGQPARLYGGGDANEPEPGAGRQGRSTRSS